ncbi:MAG: 5-formyltetrahydrofolate cyclo-ligase [Gammaproteobacteria bacterium AqS3]|nr:5-formyltetrahydrofolate cyclo-ligase [Gammaproteobacteria bacterium AqS3]
MNHSPARASARRRLRRRLRQVRRSLSPLQQRLAAHALARRLRRLPGWDHLRQIGCYCPAGGEIDVLNALHLARRDLGHLALPRTAGGQLHFADALAPRCRSRLGVRVPVPGARPVPARRLDAVIAPGLGFAEDGWRLGQGGGFYDRHLSRYPRGLRIGIAHESQMLQAEAGDLRCGHDVDMDWIATPRRLIRCRSRRHLPRLNRKYRRSN